jgi:hypothetical protein
MKKIIIMASCMLFISSMAFAADNIQMNLTDNSTTGKTIYGASTSGGAAGGGLLIGKNSTGVGTGMLTNANGYAMVTQHIKGSKIFGTSYDSTSLFAKLVTDKGTPELDVPNGTDTTDFTGSGWAPL